MEPNMRDKVYRLPTTLNVTGLCRSSLYDQLKKGQFPEPVKLGKRAVGWRESDLDAWITSRQKRNATEN
jgi:prophage regulatory protein